MHALQCIALSKLINYNRFLCSYFEENNYLFKLKIRSNLKICKKYNQANYWKLFLIDSFNYYIHAMYSVHGVPE